MSGKISRKSNHKLHHAKSKASKNLLLGFPLQHVTRASEWLLHTSHMFLDSFTLIQVSQALLGQDEWISMNNVCVDTAELNSRLALDFK
jgi:hypothetical protein